MKDILISKEKVHIIRIDEVTIVRSGKISRTISIVYVILMPSWGMGGGDLASPPFFWIKCNINTIQVNEMVKRKKIKSHARKFSP